MKENTPRGEEKAPHTVYKGAAVWRWGRRVGHGELGNKVGAGRQVGGLLPGPSCRVRFAQDSPAHPAARA